jgi:hypothetical protein
LEIKASKLKFFNEDYGRDVARFYIIGKAAIRIRISKIEEGV